MSRWKMGGMSKASTDPFCLAPLRQRETRLDGSEGVRLLSAHSTPKKRWCKRCNTPMGNLIQTLLPAVILLLQGKIAKQVSPYPSILTLIIAGNYTHVVLYYKSAVPLLFANFDLHWWRSTWHKRVVPLLDMRFCCKFIEMIYSFFFPKPTSI